MDCINYKTNADEMHAFVQGKKALYKPDPKFAVIQDGDGLGLTVKVTVTAILRRMYETKSTEPVSGTVAGCHLKNIKQCPDLFLDAVQSLARACLKDGVKSKYVVTTSLHDTGICVTLYLEVYA